MVFYFFVLYKLTRICWRLGRDFSMLLTDEIFQFKKLYADTSVFFSVFMILVLFWNNKIHTHLCTKIHFTYLRINLNGRKKVPFLLIVGFESLSVIKSFRLLFLNVQRMFISPAVLFYSATLNDRFLWCIYSGVQQPAVYLPAPSVPLWTVHQRGVHVYPAALGLRQGPGLWAGQRRAQLWSVIN